MANISWGKPTILVVDLEAGEGNFTWIKTADPVENSTTLATTKGEKKEAKVEGGENEDVKYSKNTYVLNYGIRKAKGRTKHINDNDGIVNHKYAVVVIPEDDSCPGILIQTSTVSLEDNFSSEDGIVLNYAHDVLKPSSGNQVKYGTAKVTYSSGTTVSKVTFKPDENNSGNKTYNITSTVELTTEEV